jgi:hypothetical protein
MKNLIRIFALTFLIFTQAYSQKVEIKPFSIDKSDLIGDLKNLKAANPKLTIDDFVRDANLLFDKKGINFVVGFDSATCQKIDQIKKAQKDQTKPLNLQTTLKSSIGEAVALRLPEATFVKNECVSCNVILPFLEVTDTEFVTIVQGINLKFNLPANFFINEISLVDEKDYSAVKRKWKIPFKTVPLSISDDGNIVYLGFDEPELADLALIAFGEGSYQLYPRRNLDSTKKGTIVKDISSNTIAPNFAVMKFESPGLKQFVKFPVKCQN